MNKLSACLLFLRGGIVTRFVLLVFKRITVAKFCTLHWRSSCNTTQYAESFGTGGGGVINSSHELMHRTCLRSVEAGREGEGMQPQALEIFRCTFYLFIFCFVF